MRGLQRRELAAAKLPEGEPARASAEGALRPAAHPLPEESPARRTHRS
jgi:hypothetical protein